MKYLTFDSWHVPLDTSNWTSHSQLFTFDMLLLSCQSIDKSFQTYYSWHVNLDMSFFICCSSLARLDLSLGNFNSWLVIRKFSLLTCYSSLDLKFLTCQSWYVNLFSVSLDMPVYTWSSWHFIIALPHCLVHHLTLLFLTCLYWIVTFDYLLLTFHSWSITGP